MPKETKRGWLMTWGVPFLRGNRAGAFGDAAHGVQGGGHGLEVIAGHRVRVLPLPGRASLDPGHDQREAEAELQVVVRALDLVGDRAEHRAGYAGERHPVRSLERDPLGEALPAEVDVPVEDGVAVPDRKSTRLNSSHPSISYAVF